VPTAQWETPDLLQGAHGRRLFAPCIVWLANAAFKCPCTLSRGSRNGLSGQAGLFGHTWESCLAEQRQRVFHILRNECFGASLAQLHLPRWFDCHVTFIEYRGGSGFAGVGSPLLTSRPITTSMAFSLFQRKPSARAEPSRPYANQYVGILINY
jgi:hypothetical protein